MGGLLEGQIALITGAGQGLGQAYALELAKQGAYIIVNDIATDENRKSLADQTVAKIILDGGRAEACNVSIEDANATKDMIRTCVERHGKIDVLIHNAGVTLTKSMDEQTLDEWDKVLKIHLDAAFYLLRSVCPVMKKNRYGRIVLVTSSAGMFGIAGNTAYAAAKMGIWGLVKSFNKEVKSYGILCNGISPLARTSNVPWTESEEFYRIFTTHRVAACVSALCFPQINEGGYIYVIAGGSMSRVEICENEGIALPDEKLNALEILRQIKNLQSMDKSVPVCSIEQAGKRLFKKAKKANRHADTI